MKFTLFNNSKLPKRVKKIITPSQTFTKKTKGRFLATFDAHNPATAAKASTSRFVFILKITAGIAAILIVLLSGVSAYADTADVSVNSPLYPLKRLGESVQLAVTPSAAKPQLEANFAIRRANEITALASQHPTSTLLPRLAGDLASDVDASIGGAGHDDHSAVATTTVVNLSVTANATTTATTTTSTSNNRGHRGSGQGNNEDNLKSVCGTLRSLFGSSSSIIRNVLHGRSGVAQRFADQCDGNNDDDASSTSGMPGSFPGMMPTSTATSTASSTTHFRGGPGPRKFHSGTIDL